MKIFDLFYAKATGKTEGPSLNHVFSCLWGRVTGADMPEV